VVAATSAVGAAMTAIAETTAAETTAAETTAAETTAEGAAWFADDDLSHDGGNDDVVAGYDVAAENVPEEDAASDGGAPPPVGTPSAFGFGEEVPTAVATTEPTELTEIAWEPEDWARTEAPETSDEWADLLAEPESEEWMEESGSPPAEQWADQTVQVVPDTDEGHEDGEAESGGPDMGIADPDEENPDDDDAWDSVVVLRDDPPTERN